MLHHAEHNTEPLGNNTDIITTDKFLRDRKRD